MQMLFTRMYTRACMIPFIRTRNPYATKRCVVLCSGRGVLFWLQLVDGLPNL